MTYFILGDCHHPYMDKAAFRAFRQALRSADSPGVIILGDFLDCTPFSKYPKSLAERSSWKKEIAEANACLDVLCDEADPVHFVHGNHEDRLTSYITKNAPELEGGVPSVGDVLRFEDRGIEDHGRYFELPKHNLILTHGTLVRKHSAFSAKAMQEKTGGSIIMGHTHRLGSFFYTDWSGTYRAYENGCMCRMDLPWLKDKPNWQQGFSVVHLDSGGKFDVEQHFIQKGKTYDPSGGWCG